MSAVDEMDRAVRALALELPALVHEDVAKRWQNAKAEIADALALKEAVDNEPELFADEGDSYIDNAYRVGYNDAYQNLRAIKAPE